MTRKKSNFTFFNILLIASVGFNFIIIGIYLGSFIKPDFRNHREARSASAALIGVLPDESRKRLRTRIYEEENFNWTKIDRKSQRNLIRNNLLKDFFDPDELREILRSNAQVLSYNNEKLIDALIEEISTLKKNDRFILAERLKNYKKRK